MAMKAYACPRCLTLSSETEDGDGGPHECNQSPFAAELESQLNRFRRALEIISEISPADGADSFGIVQAALNVENRLSEIQPPSYQAYIRKTIFND